MQQLSSKIWNKHFHFSKYILTWFKLYKNVFYFSNSVMFVVIWSVEKIVIFHFEIFSHFVLICFYLFFFPQISIICWNCTKSICIMFPNKSNLSIFIMELFVECGRFLTALHPSSNSFSLFSSLQLFSLLLNVEWK